MDTQSGSQSGSLVGTQLGRYRIEAKLGAGGMGEVFRALDVDLHRPVALKTLRPEIALDSANVERFFAEARAANVIRHEHIVEYTDMHKAGPGQVSYVVMELLEGRTLTRAIRDRGRIAPERAVFIAAQVADALEASHRAGVVHRDLKPDNVFLIRRMGTDDYVKVLDFGVARLRPGLGGAGSVQATQTGMIIGTPAYMSPEQCKGEKAMPAADVYALGVILFQMLTGQLPFDGATAPMMLVAHMMTEPPRVHALAPDVPAALSMLVAQALAKQPEDRPSSMAALRDAMLAAVGMEAFGPALTADVAAPRADAAAWAQGTPQAKARPGPGATPGATPGSTFDTSPEPMATMPARGQRPAGTALLGGQPAKGSPAPPAGDPTVRGRPAPPRPSRQIASQAPPESPGEPGAERAPGRFDRVPPLSEDHPVFEPQASESPPATTLRRDHPRPVTPAPTLAPGRAARPAVARRRRGPLLAGAAALLACAAGGVLWGMYGSDVATVAVAPDARTADAPDGPEQAAALRQRLDTLTAAHDEPAPPVACRTDDAALLARLVQAASLLQGGAPDSRREQDIEAVRVLAEPPPQVSEHWYWLAKARLYAEANAAAVTDAAGRAIAACKGYAAAHNAVGSALFRERPAEAEAAYHQAVVLAPGFAAARFNLGLIQIERGELEDALDSLTAVVDGPDAPPALRADALLARGGAHLQASQPERAIADLERAVEAAPDNAAALFLLGQAHALAGRADAAREAMCKARALGHTRAAEHCPQ
jgi:Flp pilus assembly protein TadD